MANFVVTYPFDNSSEYEKVNTEISAGKGRLSLTDNTGETFNQPFTSDSGFTYDSAKAEFVAGKVQQKSQVPADATFYASYNSNISGTWGDGVLTGTAIGGASVSGGKLDLKGGGKAVAYSGIDNADSLQTGCIRFKFTPNYSGIPSSYNTLINLSQNIASNVNSIIIRHEINGRIYLDCRDSSGVIIVTSASYLWSPTLGQEYEFELNWDFTAGATRLFIGGTQAEATYTGTGTRSGAVNILRIGSNTALSPANFANGEFDDFMYFSTVQHTANYTPVNYEVPYIYAETKVELPQFSYSDLGNLQAFTAFAVTDSNSPKYVLNDLYYNSGWVSSDGSYAQANSEAEVLANIASLPASNTLDIDVAFDDGSSQMSVDDLTTTYTGQQYYASGSIVTGEISAEDFISFISTEINTANTTITYAVYVNGSLYYYSGSAWVSSNGLFAQTNTAAEMNTNLPTLLSAPSTTKFYILISTSDQQETGEIDMITSSYEFVGESTDLTTCVVWGYYKDISGNPVSGATVTFKLVRNSSEYKEASNNVIEKSNSTTTDSTGYFELPLIRSSEYEGSAVYTITITKQSDQLSTTKTNEGAALEFIVPDELDKNITNIFTAS